MLDNLFIIIKMSKLTDATADSPKYRLLKLWNRYVVQKLWQWITPESYWCLVWSYANETKPLDYDTAIAYIKLRTWDMEILWSWNTLDELLLDCKIEQ